MHQFRTLASIFVLVLGLLSLDAHAAAITKKYSNFTYTHTYIQVYYGAQSQRKIPA